MRKNLRRVISIILSIMLVLGYIPTPVFAASARMRNISVLEISEDVEDSSELDSEEEQIPEPNEEEDREDSSEVQENPTSEEAVLEESFTADADVSEILDSEEETTEEITEELTEKDAEEDTEEESPENMPVFSETKTVDGVNISVNAPEGVFPEGAVLSVNKVSLYDQNIVDDAIDEIRDDNVNVAASYTFDIKVLDIDGNEIQPADGQSVQVSFTLAEVASENLDTAVYHIEDDSMSAEKLDAVESGETVEASTDGFSYYTVEFTYNEKQYVMNGDTTIALSDILDYVGLTGEVTAVSVSDESLFSASNESGEWMVTAHQAFTSEEWMKVTIDGVEYEIKITDSINITITIESVTTTSDKGKNYRFISLAPNASEINNYNGGDGRPNWGLPSNQSSGDITITVDSIPDNLYFYVGYDDGGGGGATGPVGTLSNGASNTITATYSMHLGMGGYMTMATATIKYHVNKASSPSVTAPTLASDLTFNGSAQQLITSAGTTSGNNMKYGISSSSTTAPTTWYSSISDSNLKKTIPGTYYVWYKADAIGNYTAVEAKCAGNVKIGKAGNPLTYTATQSVSKAFSTSSQTESLTAASNAQGNLSYAINSQKNSSGTAVSYFTLSGTTLTIAANTPVGTYTVVVRATAAGNGNYYSGTKDSTVTVKIEKADNPLTYTATQSVSNAFSTSSQTTTLTAASNAQGNLSYAINSQKNSSGTAVSYFTLSGTTLTIAANTPAGTYTVEVRATAAGNGNYNSGTKDSTVTVTINKANTNTVSVNITGWTYGSTANSPSCTATFGANTATYSYSNAENGTYTSTVPSNAGTWYVKATVPGTNNYAGGTAIKSFVISKKDLTITAEAKIKTYDNTSSSDPELTATVTGKVGSDKVNYSLSREGGQNAGEYAITVTAGNNPNYNVKVNGAKFTINQKAVTITTGSAEKEYDGKPLTSGDVSITGLVTGQSVTLTATGTITDVGSTTNIYSIEWDNATQGNYSVTDNLGTLKVNKNDDVTLTAASESKTYDGTDLTNSNVSATGLPVGFTAEASAEGTQKDAGSSANIVKRGYKIKNSLGEDKTEYFTVNTVEGKLTVEKAPLSVTTGTAAKQYDGTALTNYNAEITGFVGGETATVIATGSQTEVGSSDNVYDITWDTAKQSNYTITDNLGKLTVTENSDEVKLIAPSDSKDYDGTPLSCDGTGEKKVLATGLPVGFTVEATASGTITNAGTEVNIVNDGYVIKNESGVDKTANFTNIQKIDGTLTINPASVTLTADSKDTDVYDGTEKSVTGFTSSVDGLIFEGVSASGSGIDAGDYDVTFTGVTLNTTKDTTGNYVVTEITDGTLTINPASVTLTANSRDTDIYDGTEKSVTGFTSSVDGLLFEGVNANGSGTDAGDYDVTFTGVIVNTTKDTTGNYVVTGTTDGTLTINPASVTLTADSKDTDIYDGTEKSVTGFESSVAGLTFEGVNASGSGTDAGDYDVIFTGVTLNTTKDTTGNYVVTGTTDGTLTINPASVTLTADSKDTDIYDGTEKSVTGFESSVAGLTFEGVSASGSGTDAGDYDVTFTGVTLNTTKDTTGNYVVTGTTDGTLIINPASVTLTANSRDTDIYDETEKTVTGYTASVEGLIFEGVSASGSGTDAGDYDVTFTGVIENITRDTTGNYVVTEITDGTLTINPAGVTLTANSRDTDIYDGIEKSVTGFESSVAGLTFEGVNASGSGTDAGEYGVTFSGVTLNTTKDTTGNYVVIGTTDGTLTINPASVTLTASSKDTDVYDGTEKSVTGFIASVDGLAFEGVSANGSGTDAGDYDVTFTGVTLNTTKDTTGNYVVTGTTDGTLTINPASVTLTAESRDTDIYDGTEKSVTGFTSSVDGLTFTGVSASGSGTDVGDYDVTFTGVTLNTTKDTTGNYVVTGTTDGNLTINKRKIAASVEDKEAEYNGSEQSGNTEVAYDELVSGHTASVTYIPSKGTLVGTYDNSAYDNTSFKVMNGETDVTANYILAKTTVGKLTINDRTKKYEITVKANSAEYTYDGTEKSISGFETLEFTVDGNTYTVSGLITSDPKGTDICEKANAISGTAVVKDSNDNDVTAQFDVKTENGKLTINKRNITASVENKIVEYNGSEQSGNTNVIFNDIVTGHTASIIYTPSNGKIAGTYDNGAFDNTSFKVMNGETDVTGNYTLEKVTAGKLIVNDRTKKYEITVKANSSTDNTYDGTEKSVSGFETLEFTVDGNTYTVSGLTTSDPKSTDACEIANAISGTAVVKDSSNIDVTGQFIVNTIDGTLTINKRSITLTSATDSKKYDGKALTNEEVTVGGNGWVTGEGATYSVTGSQKIVGSSANTFSYTLNDGTKADNYDITKNEGTLTVTSRDAKYEISPQADSDVVKYDGTEHEVSSLVTDIFTVDGNTYTVSGLTVSGKGTDAGEYAVNVTGTAIVKDSDGNDVTEQFSVTPISGTLKINKRSVTLTSATASKKYDGDALTDDTVTVSGDGFVNGEGASYDVTGTRTLVGTSDNTFTYTLNDGTGADNYTISTSLGTLTVENRDAKYEVKLTANSDTITYDGSDKTVSGYTIDGNAGEGTGTSTVTSFTASNGKTYTVSGMSAEVSGKNAGEYAVNVTGTPVVKDSNSNDVTDQFTVSVESGKLKINKRSVTLTSATASKAYDGKPLTDDTVTVSGDGWASGEGADYNVTGSQTLPGESSNAFTYTFKDGTSADNYAVTVTSGTLTITDRNSSGTDGKYEITVKANSAEYTYDGTEHSVSGFETLKFTFNDIEYTVSGLTAAVSGTDAGTYTSKVTGTAVVKDAGGNDLTDQFIVNTTNGTLTINKRSITLTSATASKTYDGKALTNEEVTVGGAGWVTGEGAAYSVTGSQKVVGNSANTFSYALNDGTKADNYDITKNEGTLTVTSRDAKYEISPQAGSDVVKYDGTEHEVSSLVTDTFTVDGNTYTVSGLTVSGKGTDAGEYTVNVTGIAIVKDSDGNDVTDQFSVNPQSGKLTINKRSVTLTSASADKEYDGDALTADNVSVSGDGWASGEGASYDVTGTRTLVGEAENAFTYTLNDGTKAENYNITTSFGTLTVKDRTQKMAVTIIAVSNTTAIYDGTRQTIDGFTISIIEDLAPLDGYQDDAEDLAPAEGTDFTASNGKTYTVSGITAEASGVNAGEYPVNIIGTPVVTDIEGNEVTGQFDLSLQTGKLIINKRSIILTSADDEKEYDGTALTNDKVTVTGDGWAPGEGAVIGTTGKQTNVGSSENTITYTLNDNTVADNYDISVVTGTLKVTKGQAKADVKEASNLTYDGTPKSVLDVTDVEGGTIMYRLGTDGEWSSEIPQMTNAGTNIIYYYIKGDENHSDDGSEESPKGSIEVTVQKAAQGKMGDEISGVVENGTGNISGLNPEKTYQYSSDGGKTWIDIEKGTKTLQLVAGVYLFRYAGDANYEAGLPIEITISTNDSGQIIINDGTKKIIIRDGIKKESGNDSKKTDNNAATGDESVPLGMMGLMILALTGIVTTKKYKKKH